jgi:hypothetical protein
MSRRRAKVSAASARVESDDLPVSARVAWTYLVALIAAVIAAAVVVLSNQLIAPVVCTDPSDGAIADCKFALGLWVALGSFLVVLIPVALKAHLDGWLVALLWAEIGLWVAADAIDRWWWWAAVVLMPAVAALASAQWGGNDRVRLVQRIGIVAVLIGAIAALVWWYLRG